MPPFLRTPLYPTHRELGARMVEFGGWEMPVQYSGIIAEHQAVRAAAGLFDVSHMGRIGVRGPDAGAFLDHLMTNDIAHLSIGRARYGMMCNEGGGILDDVIASHLDVDDYLVVCNAASWERMTDWMAANAPGREVELTYLRDETAMLALQGPKAVGIAVRLCGQALASLKRFGVDQVHARGVDLIVSRTGYTGEDGFEFIIDARAVVGLWHTLLEDAVPCGLGARDTLRLEAGLLLYGQDMGAATTPLEAGLEKFVMLDRDFIGAEALRQQAKEGLQRRLRGFVTEGRQAPRHGYPVYIGDKLAGTVTSGSFSPTLQKGVGLAYLPPETALGAEVRVDVRGTRVDGKVVPLPFYEKR